MKRIANDIVKGFVYSWQFTVLFCIAWQNKWILSDTAIPDNGIPRDEFWMLYKSIALSVVVFLITFDLGKGLFDLENSLLDRKKEKVNKNKLTEEKMNLNKQDLKICAIHEAGHIVMAGAMNITIIEKKIFDLESGEVGGNVRCMFPSIWTPKVIKKRVLINYSGLLAERILLGCGTNGCMGSQVADVEYSNQLLKQYIILTDSEVSLAGMECEEEKIKVRMAELSKNWEREAEDILKQFTQKIEEEAEELLKQYYDKKRE